MHTDRLADRHALTDRQSHRHKEIQTYRDKNTDRHTNTHTYRLTDRQRDRHTDSHK